LGIGRENQKKVIYFYLFFEIIYYICFDKRTHTMKNPYAYYQNQDRVKEDFQYFAQGSGFNKNIEELNEKIIVDFIDEKYKAIDVSVNEWKSVEQWVYSIGLLHFYLRVNFENFEQTEEVYRWAKELCDEKNIITNMRRALLN
jgi:hypothetical protein